VTVPHEANGRKFDPGTRRILEELRDMRVEARAERQQAEADRRQADERYAHLIRRSDERYARVMQRSDERFEQAMREFRKDSVRRTAETQRTFRDIHTVGLSIVKTLNHHTRILERIDRKLGVRGNGGPGRTNNRGA
jgi:hypothetical protein